MFVCELSVERIKYEMEKVEMLLFSIFRKRFIFSETTQKGKRFISSGTEGVYHMSSLPFYGFYKY